MNSIVKTINYKNKPSIFVYQEDILPHPTYHYLLDFLDTQNFKGGTCISGAEIPRLQIWYHLQESFFCDTWKYRYDRWKGEAYQPILLEVQKIIEEKTRNLLDSILQKSQMSFESAEVQIPQFNSCLANKYRNGQDSIKPHQDSSTSFGSYPTISILSLASSRDMIVRPLGKLDKKKLDVCCEDEIVFPLAPNSLFIMAGASQKYFTHSIPKQDTELHRYSLTFREHLSS